MADQILLMIMEMQFGWPFGYQTSWLILCTDQSNLNLFENKNSSLHTSSHLTYFY